MDKLLTIGEVAEATRLSVGTLRWMRQTGKGPAAGKLGKRLVYREADVRSWVDAQFKSA